VLTGESPKRRDARVAAGALSPADAVSPADPRAPAVSARRRTYRRVALALLVLVLIPGVLAAGSLTWLGVEGSGNLPATIPATGGDGLWLGHAWVDGGKTSADLSALAARIKRDGIRDVFVHDGPLSADGSLSPRLSPRASWLVSSLHALAPGVRVQAWLGDLVGPGNLDLDNPQTRSRILQSVGQALGDGFDGIHFDMEPVDSGDQGYVDLLAATYQVTRDRRKVLSIAADQVEPLAGFRLPASLIAGQAHYWSSAYLSALARNVDEVALMTYNTGMPSGGTYSGFVRLETGIALRAMPPGVHLLIGLPAYPAVGSYHSGAETVGNAIRGVRLALGTSSRAQNIGVAMYADFSATPADWTAYQASWAAVRKS
jgi:hypothetical protein